MSAERHPFWAGIGLLLAVTGAVNLGEDMAAWISTLGWLGAFLARQEVALCFVLGGFFTIVYALFPSSIRRSRERDAQGPIPKPSPTDLGPGNLDSSRQRAIKDLLARQFAEAKQLRGGDDDPVAVTLWEDRTATLIQAAFGDAEVLLFRSGGSGEIFFSGSPVKLRLDSKLKRLKSLIERADTTIPAPEFNPLAWQQKSHTLPIEPQGHVEQVTVPLPSPDQAKGRAVDALLATASERITADWLTGELVKRRYDPKQLASVASTCVVRLKQHGIVSRTAALALFDDARTQEDLEQLLLQELPNTRSAKNVRDALALCAFGPTLHRAVGHERSQAIERIASEIAAERPIEEARVQPPPIEAPARTAPVAPARLAPLASASQSPHLPSADALRRKVERRLERDALSEKHRWLAEESEKQAKAVEDAIAAISHFGEPEKDAILQAALGLPIEDVFGTAFPAPKHLRELFHLYDEGAALRSEVWKVRRWLMNEGNEYRARLRHWYDTLKATAVEASGELARSIEEAPSVTKDNVELSERAGAVLGDPTGAEPVEVNAAIHGVLLVLGPWIDRHA